VGARFPHDRRLRRRADFDRVYQQGQRHFSGHMTVFFIRGGADFPRVGFTVGRALGGAVQRNRIRRRLREAVRLRLAQLAAPVDVVVHPRKSALKAQFTELLGEIGRAFEVITQRAGTMRHAQ
jgi:ribonuclease P protein component